MPLCRFANHERSKKHKENVALLKQLMREEAEAGREKSSDSEDADVSEEEMDGAGRDDRDGEEGNAGDERGSGYLFDVSDGEEQMRTVEKQDVDHEDVTRVEEGVHQLDIKESAEAFEEFSAASDEDFLISKQ